MPHTFKENSQTLAHQLRIKVELINILYQQANTALIGVIVTATGIAFIFHNVIPVITVSIWLGSIYVLSLIRYFSIKKFKSLQLTQNETICWGYRFAFFAFLSGLTWGSASVLLYTPGNMQLFSILTLIIIALSMGSLAALSAFPYAYYLFIVGTITPMIWRYLNAGESSYQLFGLLLFVFVAALFLIIRVNNRFICDSIILRFENVNLIKQLTVQKEKAEQASVAKTKFLAAASHDIRQPLHAMGLFLGALEDRVEKEDQKVIVKKIQKSSSALNNLLDSLLDISKLDAGVVDVVIAPFSINHLFDAIKSEFRSHAEDKGLKIRFVKTRLWVNSDYRMVERMVRNLISNAIKYTNSGGVVVGCRRYKTKIKIVVYDTGMGIDKDKCDEIFNEFYQIHNPERDRSKGLGLGLSIVDRMAKLLDAPLIVKSTLEKGSSFAIVLPMSIPSALPQKLSVTNASAQLYFTGKCVLVVDDEEAIRDSLCELLQSWGCDVIAAESGSEAVMALKNNETHPDIILSDYRLRHNETGIEAVNEINSSHDKLAIPAIIITGDTAPDRIKQVEKSGFKIIHKPVSVEELRTLLGTFLLQNDD